MAKEITKDSLKSDIFNAYQAEKAAKEAAENELTHLKNEPALITPEALSTLRTQKDKFQAESELLRALFPDVKEFNEDFLDNIPEMDVVIHPGPVTVVIPYIKEFAQGNELQMALRGWDKHFKEDFRVVVIGDREPWMNDQVDVIECKRIGNNPPIDIAHKMLLAIESDLVSEKFIWSNDDQYLVSPCVLADFETLKCEGRLKEPFPNNLYGRNKKATTELLKEAKKPTFDFSTHTPFVFEKEKLADLIEEFELTKNAHLISSLYYNWFFPDFVPLRMNLEVDNIKVGVYRPNANFGKLKQLIPQKKLVSNSQSGWTEEFSKIMNKIHSEKCRFEK